jgi:diacylglycerol kinase family enzyme
MGNRIDIIATTVSGSISDWKKVKRIVPLFGQYGEDNANLHVVDTHAEARTKSCELVRSGSQTLISAGGSGTFNAVIEGCYDAGVSLDPLRIGFLRKGSADLIGKVLGMPDDIEQAIELFVEAIRNDFRIPCDVLLARSEIGDVNPRHFVGYGGAEIFGEIPRYTETRFMKYYKGILGQLFGDLGPFAVGSILAIMGMLFRSSPRRRQWEIIVDGQRQTSGYFQTMIIVNGDLGPTLPFAKDVPLGSGDFYLFTIRNLGWTRLSGQLKAAWNTSILNNPDKWGFEGFCIKESLELRPSGNSPFPINADGSIIKCSGAVRIEIVGQLQFLSRPDRP